MFNRLRTYFLSGLVVFLPSAMTIYLLILMVNWGDGVLGKYIEPYFSERFGFYFRGLSILLGVYLIIMIGFLASNFLGRRIYSFFESFLLKLPFFRQVYPAIKEIAVFLFSKDRLAFKQVVIIEYPRKGLYSFGFLTNESSEFVRKATRQELCNVFIPSAPGPFTGYVMMCPKKDIIMTDVTVDQAIKFIVSGGVVNPQGQLPQ